MSLDWPDCTNARDLGGTPTRDGGVIRDGALIRSDSLGALTPASVEALRERGLALILDLRWPRECENDPSPFAAEPVYRNVPLLGDPLGYEPPDDTYAPMLDHNAERIGRAFRVIAAAPAGGVVVHCHGGRDRTGVVVALLLALAGAGREVIARDYARTPGSESDAMLATLTHLEERHGGVEAYLREAGVSSEELAAIRQRLI